MGVNLKRYWREIKRYDSSFSDWMEEGDNIVKLYMDEESNRRSTRRYALLWANVETLKPAIYVKPPAYECERRFKDADPIGRIASEIMQRCLNSSMELEDVDQVFKAVRDDRLLPGRGTAWVRYDAEISENETEVEDEHVCVDYVYWKDFGHNVAKIWKEVWLVWRITYKEREDMEERFGKEAADKVSYNSRSDMDDNDDSGETYCKLYEVWDKRAKTVSWIVNGLDEALESGPPPFTVHGFFPTPEPCYATKTSKKLIPRADYLYYRDQAKEINDLTSKIYKLTRWLIVKAFVPGAPSGVADPIEEILREKSEDELFVQVTSWAEFTDRGGVNEVIQWLPIDKVVQAIQAAIEARAALIQDVFSITGIADVLRAQTDPQETLGAVELKSQTGTRRLRNTKDEIARYCRDIGRLTAEIICENFQPQTIARMSGFVYQPMMAPGQGGMVFDDQVMQLLRDDRMRNYRIEVEPDSIIQADENAEKQRRTEFTTMAGTYLTQAASTVKEAPALAPVVGEMLMFALRSFRAGRNLEEVIEKSFQMLVQQTQQAASAPPPVDPMVEVAKVQVQADVEKNKASAMIDSAKIQSDAMLTKRKQDIDAALKIREQNIKENQGMRQHVAAMAPKIPGLPK